MGTNHMKVVAVLFLCLAPSENSGNLANASDLLSIATNEDSSFAVKLINQTWLPSAAFSFFVGDKAYSTKDGSLKKISTASSETGVDEFGDFTRITTEWSAGSTAVVTSITTYKDVPAIIFAQTFPAGANRTNSSHDVDGVGQAFPTFSMSGKEGDKGFLTYAGGQFGFQGFKLGQWYSGMNASHVPGGLTGGYPLILFNNDASLSMVISPFSEFMASSQVYADGVMSCGLMAPMRYIPAEFTLKTVIYASTGINKAMEGWGSMLLKAYGKDRTAMENDFSLKYLGYYTDAGAYYFFHTEQNKTYEETLLDVKQYSLEAGIPYRHVQLDAWFYYIDHPEGGTKNWTARPDIFPHGMTYLRNKTGWPFIAHNLYWSRRTDYAEQNGGHFPFFVNPKNARAMSLPLSQEFWEYLLQESKKWGLIVYEQDFLSAQTTGLEILHTDPLVGRNWLRQMGAAAANNDLTVQYCMTYMREALQSVEVPVVTQVRASTDYRPSDPPSIHTNQWQLGITSLLAKALALAPSKDNFWTTSKQPRNPYSAVCELPTKTVILQPRGAPKESVPERRTIQTNMTENYPQLQAAIATLSTGPVGPSDMVGGSNQSLIMRTCAADGRILKPSYPAVSTDAQLLYEAGFDGHVAAGQLYTTYTQLGQWRWTIVFAADLNNKFTATPSDFGLNNEVSLLAYSFLHKSMSVYLFDNTTHPLSISPCGRKDFQLWYIAPVIVDGSWVLLGELNKWVPVSTYRFTSIETSSAHTTVTITGSEGETVQLAFFRPTSKQTNDRTESGLTAQPGEVFIMTCTIQEDGTAKAVVKTDAISYCDQR